MLHFIHGSSITNLLGHGIWRKWWVLKLPSDFSSGPIAFDFSFQQVLQDSRPLVEILWHSAQIQNLVVRRTRIAGSQNRFSVVGSVKHHLSNSGSRTDLQQTVLVQTNNEKLFMVARAGESYLLNQLFDNLHVLLQRCALHCGFCGRELFTIRAFPLNPPPPRKPEKTRDQKQCGFLHTSFPSRVAEHEMRTALPIDRSENSFYYVMRRHF